MISNLPYLKFNAEGLIPVILQDVESQQVLMMGWMNAEALTRTVQTGLVHFWSRSRKTLWRKGETSGNLMRLVEIFVDCDADALLVRVIRHGPACHTGVTTCFSRNLKSIPAGTLSWKEE